jgi:hypothetical protein
MVEPPIIEGRPDPSRVQDRAWRGGRWGLGTESEAEPFDYRARVASRRSSMRAHPSAQGKSQRGDEPPQA